MLYTDAFTVRVARIIVVLLAGVALAACTSSDLSEEQLDELAAGTLAVFDPYECPFEVYEGEDIECGYLIVPEDRTDPGTLQVELAVAILRSPNPNPAPDPILYLSGGPGDSALSEVDLWLESPLLEDRDVILLDQRGTGYSIPTLNCPEIEDLDYLDFVTLDDEADAAAECSQRLTEEGVVLTAYNSATSAADVDALRRALGYDAWNLIGISYGARLALTVMRDYPQGIRSVILDSAYPPEVQAYETQAVHGLRAFEVLFADCAADPACAANYPDLHAVFLQQVANLNVNPVTVSVDDPEYGDSYDVDVTGDDLSDELFNALYDTVVIPYLPYMIYEAGQGRYEPLSQLMAGTLGGDVPEFEAPDPLDSLQSLVASLWGEEDFEDSEGAYYSVECREEVPFNAVPEAEAEADAADVPEVLRDSLLYDAYLMADACAVWGAGEAEAVESEPVQADIPTLVMAGEYDPITPPEWGRSAASHLTDVTFFEYPGVGHAAIDGGDCPLDMAVAFLNDPTTPPDAGCIGQMGGPAFYVP